MAKSEEQRPGPERYSFIAQLVKRLTDEMNARFERLSPASLKAMMAYFEKRQLDIAFEISATDDALTSAKLRGQVELLTDMSSDMFSRLQAITSKKEAKDDE